MFCMAMHCEWIPNSTLLNASCVFQMVVHWEWAPNSTFLNTSCVFYLVLQWEWPHKTGHFLTLLARFTWLCIEGGPLNSSFFIISCVGMVLHWEWSPKLAIYWHPLFVEHSSASRLDSKTQHCLTPLVCFTWFLHWEWIPKRSGPIGLSDGFAYANLNKKLTRTLRGMWPLTLKYEAPDCVIWLHRNLQHVLRSCPPKTYIRQNSNYTQKSTVANTYSEIS